MMMMMKLRITAKLCFYEEGNVSRIIIYKIEITTNEASMKITCDLFMYI